MIRTMMTSRRRRDVAPALASLLVATASGCVAEEPHVEGEVVLAHRDVAAPLLHVRVFPDHPDGFDPRRIYKGDEVFDAEIVPIDAIEFPYVFRLEGEEPASGREWRVLAWLTADRHATWIEPGQVFGTEDFQFEHVSYGASYAEGLVIELAQVAPPPAPPRAR